MKRNAQQRTEKLGIESMAGAQATNEFQLLSIFFLERKAQIMDVFEAKKTLDTDELQEVHRTYKNLCCLEDYFLEKIQSGDIAQEKLNSLQEKTNE